MRRIALSLTLSAALSCVPAGGPGAGAASSDVSEDVGEEDLAPLRDLAACGKAPGSLACRALAAFALGHRPTRRPSAVSMPGAVAVIPAPSSQEAGQPPVYGAGYLVLGSGAARFQILVPSDAGERDASNALVDAVTGGHPLAADNATVVYARSRTGTRPATEVGQSLAWSGQSRGFLRETSMGLVVVERSPSVIMVAVFPP